MKKIKISIHFILIIFFITNIFIIYFSDSTSKKINKNRTNFFGNIKTNILELPKLQNDTNNVINYELEISDADKIKKRYFWNLLKDE